MAASSRRQAQMLLSHRHGEAGLGDESQLLETTGEPVGVGEVIDDETGLALPV